MLAQPWHGHADAALLVAPTLGPHLGGRCVVHAAFRREPDQDPDRALDVSGGSANFALRQLSETWVDLLRVMAPAQEEQHDDEHEPQNETRDEREPEPDPEIQAATTRRSSRSSAIWIAFSAAPLRRLSATTKRTRPFSTVGSRRMRPTRTSSISTASRGVGKS